LAAHYQGYAFSLAVCFLGNDEDAGDVVQETFIRVWKHLRFFDFRCKFTTWLYRIVINLCHDRARAVTLRNEKLRNGSTGIHGAHLHSGNDPEEKNIESNLVGIISALAGQLPPRQRSVFVLRDLQDVSIAEVAEILDISKGAVKSNLTAARCNIREKLERMEKKPGRLK
ncbi:MAG: RNA polymerase sigma factor, partial [bacterium]|nr:RNA polymerase sigma factor [bacterium]